jgi:hypothetical protein
MQRKYASEKGIDDNSYSADDNKLDLDLTRLTGFTMHNRQGLNVAEELLKYPLQVEVR